MDTEARIAELERRLVLLEGTRQAGTSSVSEIRPTHSAQPEKIAKFYEADIQASKLYTVEEVAAFLACSQANVYALMSSGEIAKTRIGSGAHGYRIKGSDITAFVDSRREGGPQPRGRLKYLRQQSS